MSTLLAVIYAKDKHGKKEQEKNEKEAKKSLGESGQMGGSGQNIALSHVERYQLKHSIQNKL